MLTEKRMRQRPVAMGEAFRQSVGRLPWASRRVLPIRRIADVVIACLLIVFALPLMVVVALAIKLETPGPIFTVEERRAAGGRSLRILKFRITADGSQRGRAAPWRNQLTCTGTFLWHTRIVDLPQLLNLLRGEMSLLDGAAPRLDFFA